MTSRAAFVLAACAAALLACGERELPSREEPAAGTAPAPAPQGEGASGRTAGRGRGDRHARAAKRRTGTVKRVDGTVARTGERQVVIGRPGAPELTLRVMPDAAVTLDGKPARLEDVPEGAEVRAAYRTGDYGRPTALSVEVRSAKR